MARVYDPRNILTYVDGQLQTDFADGVFINIEKVNDYSEYVASVTGEPGIFVINGDNAYMVTVTYKHTSPSLRILKRTAANREIINFEIRDINDVGALFFSGSGMITSPIADARSNGVENVAVSMILTDVREL